MSENPVAATLELTLLSTESLKDITFFFFFKPKPKPYALAWLDPRFKKSTKTLKTSPKNPNWDHKFSFPLSIRALENPNSCVTIQILSSSSSLFPRNRVIGTATLSISGIRTGGYEIATLQLWRPSGRAQGLVKVLTRIVWRPGFCPPWVTGVPIGGFRMTPTAPPIPTENGGRRSFLIGLLSGAVAAALIGSAAAIG